MATYSDIVASQSAGTINSSSSYTVPAGKWAVVQVLPAVSGSTIGVRVNSTVVSSTSTGANDAKLPFQLILHAGDVLDTDSATNSLYRANEYANP